MKIKRIPVHAFYVDKGAQANFTEIAARTNGECKELNIDSPQGSTDLTNLVNIQLLNNIGGSTLVAAYKTKYNAF